MGGRQVHTFLDASATVESDLAKLVLRSSPTNCVSCECVRLQKITCRLGGAAGEAVSPG